MSTDRETSGREAARHALALAGVAAVAAAGFSRLALAAAHRETAKVDEAVRRRTRAPRDHPARDAAETVSPVGKWWTYVPAALAASAWLLHAPGERDSRSRRTGAGAVMLAGIVATALNPAFDEVLPQPPAPPGHPRNKPVFPSGHAFGPGAVAFTAAYVAAREGIARPGTAAAVAAAVPLATAGGRVLVEKHWASDVLGGYLAALSLAAACAAVYEVVREGWEEQEDA
ncbi:phosphatase PAP2 family protein [Longimicrobium sp.]|uniref:phosphatase PAP2 family protein n=1 Tax=Longimicrobium sp. TaxID=2029185 RepID=UPI003B3AE856